MSDLPRTGVHPAAQSDDDALWDQWMAAYNQGDYDGAIGVMLGYVQRAPNEPLAYIFLSYSYTAKGLGQPAKAIPLLEGELEGIEESIAEDEAELAGEGLTKDQRKSRAALLARRKADAALEFDALGRAYLASGREKDAQRIAHTLQKYDPAQGARLAAESGGSDN